MVPDDPSDVTTPRRKPIAKRLRYEILRRDGNRCLYCGATTEDAPLTVDHVVPVSLGGSDDPSNLVACCRDCNAGKSSSQPDAVFVAEVNQDALLWRQLTEAAAAQLREDRRAETEFIGAALNIWWSTCYWNEPRSAEASFAAMYRANVTLEDIQYAADATLSAFGVTYRWAYFCGVVWKNVKRRDELAQEMYREVHGPVET